MQVHVSGNRVAGRCRSPPSKSYTHRAILAAGYADGATVESPLVSADTKATMRAVEAFGGDVDRSRLGGGDGKLLISGFDGRPGVPDDVVDCDNSGTTMRLVTGCAALGQGLTVLTGDDSLRTRPQQPLLDALSGLGARAESTRGNGQAPLVVGDEVDGGAVSIPGDVSSQYVTALLMAGAITDEGLEINLETELKSAPYVDITIEVLDAFGVAVDRTDSGFFVAGTQPYSPESGSYAVPGDFSSMSYLLGAGAVAGDGSAPVVVEGAQPSAQGDKAFVDVLDRMGATIEWDESAGEISVGGGALSGVEVDVGDTPDLLPTIAAVGTVADGSTRIVNCEHVRYKETDRVSAMAEELGKMGAELTEERDTLTVHGADSALEGAAVDGRGDHRIAMALAVAALGADGTTTISGAEHVDVSFPNFWETFESLGASVREA